MKLVTSLGRLFAGASLFIVGSFVTSAAWAGTYETIDVTGPDSQFNGIANSYTASSNSGNPIAIQSVQLTNDANYLYMNLTFYTPVNPNDGSAGESAAGANDGETLYLAFDTDANASTGFNVFSAGTVGSELGYQNDYPFQQASGNFNTGATVTGATALISPYDTTTSYQIIAIPLTSTINGSPVFDNSTFNVAVYASGGADGDDFTGPISYTVAEAVPEPGSIGMLIGGFAFLALVMRRRQLALS